MADVAKMSPVHQLIGEAVRRSVETVQGHAAILRDPASQAVFAKVISRQAREQTAKEDWSRLSGEPKGWLRSHKVWKDQPFTDYGNDVICCPLGVVDYYETSGVKFRACTATPEYYELFYARYLNHDGAVLSSTEETLFKRALDAVVIIADVSQEIDVLSGIDRVAVLREFMLSGDAPQESVSDFISQVFGDNTVMQQVIAEEVPIAR